MNIRIKKEWLRLLKQVEEPQIETGMDTLITATNNIYRTQFTRQHYDESDRALMELVGMTIEAHLRFDRWSWNMNPSEISVMIRHWPEFNRPNPWAIFRWRMYLSEWGTESFHRKLIKAHTDVNPSEIDEKKQLEMAKAWAGIDANHWRYVYRWYEKEGRAGLYSKLEKWEDRP